MKTKITFTIENNLINDFKDITNKKFINRSALVENLLKKWIEAEKNDEK